MKAMILAAGRGTRMRHLTAATAKPLLRLGEQALIERVIAALVKAGIREIVINVRYHIEQFQALLGDGSRYHARITYSLEQDEKLGTGGGVAKALQYLGAKPFILISGDIYSDYDLTRLLQFKRMQTAAHLLMVPNPDFHRQGDFSLAADGAIYYGDDTLTYAGIAVLNPAWFARYTQKSFSLGLVLKEMVEAGAVSGELYQGLWHNVGTPEQLHALHAQ